MPNINSRTSLPQLRDNNLPSINTGANLDQQQLKAMMEQFQIMQQMLAQPQSAQPLLESDGSKAEIYNSQGQFGQGAQNVPGKKPIASNYEFFDPNSEDEPKKKKELKNLRSMQNTQDMDDAASSIEKLKKSIGVDRDLYTKPQNLQKTGNLFGETQDN